MHARPVRGTPLQNTQDRALPSEPVDDAQPQPTQATQPKGIDPKTGKPYGPIEIPVPKEREIEDLLSRAALQRKPG